MKKILLILSAAVLALSCAKKDDGKDIDIGGYTLLKADLASLDGLTAWEEGSQIGVFGTETGANCLYTLRQKFVGSTLAEFYGPVVKGGLLAYYPYNALLRTEDGCIPFEIPSVQTYRPEATAQDVFTATAGRAFAVEEDGVLHFNWGCGLLEVVLGMTESVEVSSLTVSCEDAALSGVFLVDGNCEISASGSTLNRITADFCGNTYPSRTGENCMKVLLAVPAGYYSKLQINIVSASSDEIVAKAQDIFVERIESSEIRISSVTVGTGDIPALPVTPGYIEEN